MKHGPLSKKDENPSLLKRVRTWAWGRYNQLLGWSTLEDSETLEDGVKLHTLPHELQLYIMQYLSGRDLGNMSLSCKEAAQIASDDRLWKNLALTSGMPLLWSDDTKLPLKEKIRCFRNECRYVSEKYPKKIIDIFENAQSTAALPVLEGKWKFYEYRGCPLPLHLKGHRIVRGVGVFRYGLEDTDIEHPFIACCVKYNKIQEIDVIFLYLNRSGHLTLTWGENRNFCDQASDYADNEYIDYVKRLVAGAPCGVLGYRESTKTLMDGRSVVELTDQTEFSDVPSLNKHESKYIIS